MTHPAFRVGTGFGHLRLGATLGRPDARTLKLASYLDDAAVLPTIPPEADLTNAVASWPMYGNDRLGDCTCAAAGHMVQAWTAANGHEKTPAESAVEHTYFATGDGTDDGRVETDVLNYWRHHGLGARSHKITAYVSVDPSNLAHVRAAVYLFGGVYTGIALPKTAQTQHVWDVAGGGPDAAPGSWGGHAVPYEAYDASGFTVVTWGGTLKMTTAFHQRYTDEVYAILSPDWFRAGHTPAGFDAAALTADLAAL